MKKYYISTDKLKKVEIINFRNQILEGHWMIIMVTEKSNNICNCCNNTCKLSDKCAFSVSFYNNKAKFREICSICLRVINEYLFESIINYIDYMLDIIDTKNLLKTPPNKVKTLITTNIMNHFIDFDEVTVNLIHTASEEYQMLMHHRPDILFEDLANININLLKFFSQAKAIFDEIIDGYKMCICDRYYHPIFEMRKQCLACYGNFNSNNDIYYCRLRKKIYHATMRYNSIEKIQDLTNFIHNYYKYECYICNDDNVECIFKFDCGHSICDDCYCNMKMMNDIPNFAINCPFCRHPQKLVKDNMIAWSENYIKIKHELEETIANGKCIALTIREKCKCRSNCVIHDMMNKRNLKVWKYLEKLEDMKLLGWCDYFPDGLLINQNL